MEESGLENMTVSDMAQEGLLDYLDMEYCIEQGWITEDGKITEKAERDKRHIANIYLDTLNDYMCDYSLEELQERYSALKEYIQR